MRIDIFGKKNCPLCEETKRIVGQAHDFFYHDMETVDGLVEGAFQVVKEVPTVIISEGEEICENGVRWEGVVPTLESILSAISGKKFEGVRSQVRTCNSDACTL